MEAVGTSKDPPKPDRRRRDIGEEASEECSSDKVAELSEELLTALDKQSPHVAERDKKRNRRKST